MITTPKIRPKSCESFRKMIQQRKIIFNKKHHGQRGKITKFNEENKYITAIALVKKTPRRSCLPTSFLSVVESEFFREEFL
jgi:hypothetical protein